jgi:hypothetical protein
VVYRPRVVFIVLSLVLAVAVGGLSVVSLGTSAVSLFRGSPDKAAEWMMVALMAGGFAAFLWRQSQLRVIADDKGLTIVNYLSTHRLAWSEIERFDSRYGYYGILAVTKDGRVIRVERTAEVECRELVELAGEGRQHCQRAQRPTASRDRVARPRRSPD